MTFLLENGAYINAKSDGGFTALHLAAQHDHAHVVLELLERGVDHSTQSNGGWTPTHVASFKGHVSVIIELLERGADPNVQDHDGKTPLHVASQSGQEDVVALLLKRGGRISAQDNSGFTALHDAAQHGHVHVMKLLLKRNANINAKSAHGELVIHRAAAFGQTHVVSFLLECGMDINVTDYNGRTSLHCAVHNGHESVVELLLHRGAEINTNQFFGCSPLHLAVLNTLRVPVQQCLGCAQLLLQHGATIPTQMMNSQELLQFATDAVAHRRREVVFKLLWRGVHVVAPELGDAVDDTNATAVADKRAVDTMLAEWSRSRLRAWRLDMHALFPAALRADVQAVLLASLGSLDKRDGLVAESAVQNPLRMLHERRLLEPIFQVLLLLHMGGPPSPPHAAA